MRHEALALIAAVAVVSPACTPFLRGEHLLGAEPVVAAIAAAGEHPEVQAQLGAPVTVSTWITRDEWMRWRAGGTSRATSFPTPNAKTKSIRLLTTIRGPKGEAYFSVDAEQELATGAWTQRQAEVYGGDMRGTVRLLE